MRAKFPPTVTEKILAAAKASEDGIQEVRLGRRLFTRRHCGTSMVQVKTSVKLDWRMPFSEINQQKGDDIAVCPVCLTAKSLGPLEDPA
jgi:hypothetical protein